MTRCVVGRLQGVAWDCRVVQWLGWQQTSWASLKVVGNLGRGLAGKLCPLASVTRLQIIKHQVSRYTHQDRTTQIHLVYSTTATMSLTNASAEEAARAAKLSSRKLATLPTSARNAALDAVHDALALARSDILDANAKDLELAQKSATDGQLNPSIVKRLDLSRPGKFEDMLQGIKDVRNLDDPGRSAPAFASFLSFVISFIALLTRPRSRQG